MSFFIFLYLYLQIIEISTKPLSFPFTTRRMNDNNVMKTLINNDIYTYLYVGQNKQQMEMNIKSQKSSTFLLSTSCPENTKAKKFDENKSNSYNIQFIRKQYYMYEFKEATLSGDNFLIKQDDKDIEIKNFTFMLANTMWDGYQEYMGGMIGLKLQSKEDDQLNLPEKSNFINQLKANDLIQSYVFLLDYLSDDDGILYVGEYFETFKEGYSENDYISTKAGYEHFQLKNWEINIEKICAGNDVVQNKTYMQLFYELGIVAAPVSYQVYINITFFKDYLKNGICQELLNMEDIASFKKYYYIVCDKNNFDKSSFPKMKFYNREMNMNFTLTSEDLFYEHQNKVYFLIVFPVYGLTVEYWLMGKPLIKKYKLFLDKDKKEIGLYLNHSEMKDERDPEPEPEEKGSYTGYIIVIVILSIVLVVSVAAILYYFLVVKKSRKVRVYELEENVDYIAQKDKKEEEDNKFAIN